MNHYVPSLYSKFSCNFLFSNFSRPIHLECRGWNKLAYPKDLLCVLMTATNQAVNLAGVLVLKDKHSDEHEKRVEDIDKGLMLHQISVIAIQVLHHTDNGSNQDQNAGCVESNHMACPQTLQLDRARGRGCGDASLEDNSADSEQTEEDDLYEKTADDNMFTGIWTA